MPALISSRLLIFGESLSFHKFSNVSRNTWFSRSVCSLSLGSLGFNSDIESVDKKDTSEVTRLSSFKGVPKSKAKVVRSNVIKAAGARSSLEVDSSLFNAKSFSELGLPPLLIERLESQGFRTPTDVQSTAIPTILKDHDVVIQSYTGSGKTLAYLLPILSEVGPLKETLSDGENGKRTDIEAVIVAPSRELGMQIVREFEKILGPANKKMVQQLVGGANRSRQEEALKKNKPAIVVGTPGRIAEISAAGKLHTHGCRFLVLDEVDQLLSFNFREDMHRILEHVGRKASADSHGPKGSVAKRAERQTILVSATVPFSVIRAASSWGRNPLLVQAKNVIPLDSILPSGPTTLSGNSTSTNSTSNLQSHSAIESLPPSLKHYYCVTKLQHKVDALRRCVHALDAKSVIAFMNHTRQLKDTVFKLEARGMTASELHGDLGKLGRATTMKKFKKGEVRILVTNELSARGLDVAECDLVVNLDLPTDTIHYAHRAGRTGRLGRKGTVVTMCEESEVFVVRKLQKQLGIPILACEFTEGKLVITEEENALPALRAARA
ncbi:DEAD-box ATP-dependent RNA helicase 47B [Argentina anserina]|uniref:DEAD-box ATP-dependent RNA helicase 47B n=1 Tax=Argentina anserina TaxID=57926 RepID=UPI0021763C42|nr:DEAD-box ATP-dependent RNA helicase 47B [Potentilla anserina]XP_050364208.1 DEAD-box ATP-dependent RNA helicase 47B [Potentilla anserina]XP_050364209.1 DEAD-box ATP-dependent RNA helicase 47B [Potentilla anserina]